jgi:hypothetical protein
LGNIANNFSKAGWSWGLDVSVGRAGRERVVMRIATESVSSVRADDKLIAFVEPERTIQSSG